MRLLILLPVVGLCGCATTARDTAGPAAGAPAPAPRGPYFGEVAGLRPTLFAPGVVSQRYPELNAAFSPAGDEFFYSLADPSGSSYTVLRRVRGADGSWSPAEVASFSGRYSDADPIFSADGRRLYFISERPIGAAATTKNDFDIWFVDRAGAGWGEPVNLGPSINTPKEEYYVSVTSAGRLYWSRDGDIYRAIPRGDGHAIEKLGPNVNDPTLLESDPFVAPDESYLIFVSWGRPEGRGSGDLYVSFNLDGQWQKARSLGPEVNSTYLEFCPIVSPDGQHFFFTSNRRAEVDRTARARTLQELLSEFDKVETEIENGLGNIYWMKTSFLEALRPR
jgi:hypothetical protein